MIRSMTGFAERIIPITLSNTHKSTVSISIKSLNARYFEMSCKIPYQLNNLELALTKLIKQKLYRGNVYYTIYVSDMSVFSTDLAPSLPTIQGYVDAISQIKSKYPIAGELTISDLIALPNIFVSQEKSVDDTTKQAILSTTKELLEDLIAAQITEGSALKTDLENRLAIMYTEIDAIARANEALIEIQKEKLATVLKEIGTETTAGADIHKHAAYTLLEKMNINEEIVRFNSHLKNFKAELESPKPENGKRLDFTLQEMAREINTVASKCSDATIGSKAINIKVELEKAREQVQNIA